MSDSALVSKWEAPGFGSLPFIVTVSLSKLLTLLHTQSLISLEMYIWYLLEDFGKQAGLMGEWSFSKVLRFQSTLIGSKAWFARKLLSFHSHQKWMTPSVIHFEIKNYKPLILVSSIQQIFNYLSNCSLCGQRVLQLVWLSKFIFWSVVLWQQKLGILQIIYWKEAEGSSGPYLWI